MRCQGGVGHVPFAMADYTFFTYSPDALVYDPNNGSFTLDPNYSFQTGRNRIEFSDDDTIFDGDANNDGQGDDFNQIGTAYDDEGNQINSGTIYVQQYAVLQDANGNRIEIDRIEIDGVHVGYIPSSPLTPGVEYSYIGGDNVGRSLSDGNGGSYSNTHAHSYYTSNSVPCFAPDTLIETAEGVLPIWQVKAGDYVETLSDGLQQVLWVSRRRVVFADVAPDRRPVLIKADALGAGHPSRDLVVSHQHRVLIGTPDQGAGLADAPYLVPAKALTDLPGIRFMHGKRSMNWIHICCAGHHLIRASGCITETLLLGPQVMSGLPAMDRLRLAAQFPPEERYVSATLNGPPVQPCLSVGHAQKMIETPSRNRSVIPPKNPAAGR